MNSVYKDLREQFEADESYTGSEVLASILNAIKVGEFVYDFGLGLCF